MKAFLFFLCISPLVIRAQNSVGIGTATPNSNSRLHIDVGTDFSKGLLVTGQANAFATVPDLGTGPRLMFYPGKGAFRAGVAQTDSWDDINVGFNSVAFGVGTRASGSQSTALGFGTVASGLRSTATGLSTTASEENSFSMGMGTTAGGKNSLAGGYYSQANGQFSLALGQLVRAEQDGDVAFGYSTKARGSGSFAAGAYTEANGTASIATGNNTRANGFLSAAFGNHTISRGFASTVVGTYNDSLVTGPELFEATPTTPLFIVGNGTVTNSGTTVTRSNALAVLHSGRTHIGTSETNDGTLNNNALVFGAMGSGEGIASKRTAGGNQFGLDFFTSAQSRMSISGTGSVGIGTTTPSAKLHARTQSSGAYPHLLLEETTGGFTRLAFKNNTTNNVWTIGGLPATNHTAARLTFYWDGLGGDVLTLNGNGTATLYGGISVTSDARFKKDIAPLSGSLTKLTQLNGYNYYWKDPRRDSTQQIGLIAQEVQKVYPQLVHTDEKGMLSVNYTGLVPVLLTAVKEQQETIKSLEERLSALEKKLK